MFWCGLAVKTVEKISLTYWISVVLLVKTHYDPCRRDFYMNKKYAKIIAFFYQKT